MSMSRSSFISEFRTKVGITDTNVLDIAWKAYSKNAGVGTDVDFCILGRCNDLKLILSTVQAVQRNPGSAPDIYKDGTLCNFHAGNENEPGQFLSTDNWRIAVNDAWIMGGIEAGKNFYLVTDTGFSAKKQIEALLKGSASNPVTVSGRELIGLYTFGYKPYLKDGVLIFERKDTSKTIASYQTYRTGIYNFMQKGGKDDYDTCRNTIFKWLSAAGIILP